MPAPFAAASPMPAVLACACMDIAGNVRSMIAQQSAESILPVFGWSLVLIILLVGGFYAISKLRQWLKDDAAPGPAIGFTLSDLRQLHRQGQMTDEEFERAKAKMVASGKAMASKLPDPLARDRRGPASQPPSRAIPPVDPADPTDPPPRRRL